MVDGGIQKNWCPQLFVNGLCQFQRHLVEISLLIVLVAEQKQTKNGQKRVEAERSRYYREYPVAYGPKREKVGAGQSDTANNTLYRYCF